MVEHFGLTTAEQLTCGCHVHVEAAGRPAGQLVEHVAPELQQQVAREGGDLVAVVREAVRRTL